MEEGADTGIVFCKKLTLILLNEAEAGLPGNNEKFSLALVRSKNLSSLITHEALLKF
jgi:hypothetical protein